ncbi:LysR substrate-binding domain-containing protein [Vibrio maerlii]|uniref:LysR substrate-binding domain-containing protein n=1 Tax=Vibrio maerlii TaxID=2231648 RepID=UPI000E3E5828|nr:LysR substrate-binding domain-containing protein [Vibrio maerlii]
MSGMNWQRVDLNLLLTFDALFRFRSVSKAAESLHLGQPATSYNLKRLRELLGDPLFERDGNVMRPTARALEIEPKVREIMTILSHDILQSNVFSPEVFEGVFKIGLTDYAEQIFGPDVFDQLQTLAPKAKILFKPVDLDNCVSALESQQVDLCIGVFPDLPSKVHSTFLYREKHLCLFDNNVLKTELPISLDTYLSTPQMIITGSEELSTQVDNTLASMNIQRNVVLGTTRFLTIRRILTGRRVIAVMAEMVGKSNLIEDELTLSEPPINIPDFDIEMVCLRGDRHHPRITWLSELVKTVVQQKVKALRDT